MTKKDLKIKIRVYKDALKACKRREERGLDVSDDIILINNKLKALRKELKSNY